MIKFTFLTKQYESLQQLEDLNIFQIEIKLIDGYHHYLNIKIDRAQLMGGGLSISIADLRKASQKNEAGIDDYLSQISSAEIDLQTIEKIQLNAKLVDNRSPKSEQFFKKLKDILDSKRSKIQAKTEAHAKKCLQAKAQWQESKNILKENEELLKKAREKVSQLIKTSTQTTEKFLNEIEDNNDEKLRNFALLFQQKLDNAVKEEDQLNEQVKQCRLKTQKLYLAYQNLINSPKLSKQSLNSHNTSANQEIIPQTKIIYRSIQALLSCVPPFISKKKANKEGFKSSQLLSQQQQLAQLTDSCEEIIHKDD